MSLRSVQPIHSTGHAVPVFHPDHPHNRPPHTHILVPSQQHPNVPITTPPRKLSKGPVVMAAVRGDESDLSSPSPPAITRCFCGRETGKDSDSSIYCSRECAQRDAFSSLCYRPGIDQTLASSSAPMSRATSMASSASSASQQDYQDDDYGSHYRRMARADLRREERKEERRRRRAEGSVASSVSSASRGTMMSTSSAGSTSLSRVPDLCHSRGASIASTSSSVWSSNLSRNPSSASNYSAASGRGRVQIDDAIMEDDDEEELIADSLAYSSGGKPQRTRVYAPTNPLKPVKAHRGKPSTGNNKRLETFGMGKDMLDVLEDIISMEQTFAVEEQTSPGLFTAVFARPPRTPSPVADKRTSVIPAAPGAPLRHTRASASMSNHMSPRVQRPPSLMGLHQSSLSESHTALYLATASPTTSPGRRSASPKLQARQSLTFSADAAGPNIRPPLMRKFDSPAATPSRRNIDPSAYAPMTNWRFPTPTGSSTSNVATPTRPVPARRRQVSDPMAGADVEPALLWPPPPRDLAPSLFPTSPATGTPEFGSLHTRRRANTAGSSALSPPGSGMRLGVLLGSAIGDDMDVDTDDGSTEQGHSHMDRGYLPVFLEAEGFRSTTF